MAKPLTKKEIFNKINKGLKRSFTENLTFPWLEKAGISQHYIQQYFKSLKRCEEEFIASPENSTVATSDAQPAAGQPAAAKEPIPKLKSEGDLKFDKDYIYNEDDDMYVFLFKGHRGIGDNIVIPGETIRSIITHYSDFDDEPKTINEIANAYLFPRNVVKGVLIALKITHDSIPLTDEVLKGGDPDKLAEDLVVQKRFTVNQRLQKQSWKQTLRDAKNWASLKELTINPFRDAVMDWEPPKVPAVATVDGKAAGPARVDRNKSIILGLNDLHFGNTAEEEETHEGRGWKISDSVSLIVDLTNQTIARLREFSWVPGEIVIAGLGDILHSLTGETDKGTVLDVWPVGEDQYKAALNSIFIYVSRLLAAFPKTNFRVKSVSGNHESLGDWILMYNIGKQFESSPYANRINFDVSRKRWLTFDVQDSLFIAEHGYSPKYKSKVPSEGPARTAYIQDILLQEPEKLVGKVQNYFLVGDRHSLVVDECKHFEFIRFGAADGVSRYADNTNLGSRTRQNGLVVTKGQGVTDILSFYPKPIK